MYYCARSREFDLVCSSAQIHNIDFLMSSRRITIKDDDGLCRNILSNGAGILRFDLLTVRCALSYILISTWNHAVTTGDRLPKRSSNMADEERRSTKRSRFDQTEAEVKRPSRFDRRSRSPSNRQPESRRSRSPIPAEKTRSPGPDSKKTSGIDAAAAAGVDPHPLHIWFVVNVTNSCRRRANQCFHTSQKGHSACRCPTNSLGITQFGETLL